MDRWVETKENLLIVLAYGTGTNSSRESDVRLLKLKQPMPTLMQAWCCTRIAFSFNTMSKEEKHTEKRNCQLQLRALHIAHGRFTQS